MRALVVSIAMAVCATAASDAAADRPTKVFGYTGMTAGLGGGFGVYSDGTWEFRSHDRAQNQNGKFSRVELKRFRRVLRAAGFDAAAADPGQACETDRKVVYHDAEQQRLVTVQPPCSDVDENTRRIPTCFWSLVSGHDCDP